MNSFDSFVHSLMSAIGTLGDLLDNPVKLLKCFLDAQSLVSSIAGAFFGSLSAYWLNIRYQENIERDRQLAYLSLAISSLAGLVSKLYVAKKNFVLPRVEEAKALRIQLATSSHLPGMPLDIKLQALSMLMQSENFSLAFNVKEAQFLAKKSPALIQLICALESSLTLLNEIIYEYNAYLVRVDSYKQQIDLKLIFNYTSNLADQVNEAQYMAEKAQSVLLQYSKMEFKADFPIKNTSVQEEWRPLKPSMISSWEDVNWFVNRRSFWDRLRIRPRSAV